ncbi:MAG: hypothetical protein BKP49_00275 [Treponema sp. CETP13]|nr:MAG: hypothetical protein BKP49_00275 [Treponema sp. CETP13]
MRRRIVSFLCLFTCLTFVAFANDTNVVESEEDSAVQGKVSDTSNIETSNANKPSWSFNLGTDFAYYPDSEYVTDSDTHFAPITGAYSGLEARTTAHAVYTIPCAFSDNPFFSGNTLKIDSFLEATPVSVSPGAKVTFTPIAFLQLSAGANVATAWDLIGIQGLAEYDETTDEYTVFDSFTAYYKVWAQGMFQFDLAALIPGDWTHIVTMDSYQVYYEDITADCNGAWKYQGIGERFSVPAYYSSLVLGYQMPAVPVLNTIAVQTELTGYFNTDSIDDYYDNWDPSFMKISISPLTILTLSEKDSLIVLFGFSSRRTFTTEQNDSDATDFTLTSSNGSREWYFNRIAISWSHSF